MVKDKTKANSFKILVVDDEADLRELFSERLERSGFETCRAEGAFEAVEILRKTKVDAVLSDMKMPRGSGIDLLKQLKAETVFSKIPVFILTGYADFPESELKKLGARALFHKPADMSVIIDQINQVLESA